MIVIESFQPSHLPHVQALVNAHLSTLAPGWALPEAYLASRMERDPGQYVIGPWVRERVTLCALERERVVAAAHLLRYGSGGQINPPYYNVGDMAWLVAWPSAAQATARLLSAVEQQFRSWAVREAWAWDSGLPVGLFGGVPDVWPHIARALEAAGYRSDDGRDEAVFGGMLAQIAPATDAPLAGMHIQRTVGSFGTRFAAILDGQEAGYCDCIADLSEGGALPSLRGWGELAELWVQEAWRNRGIGSWLVRHAAAWLRFGGCERIVLSVAAEDERAGAGRFYARCGWDALVRLRVGWTLQPDRLHAGAAS